MIVMYSMEGCKLCCVAKKILDENSIEYVERRFPSDTVREDGFPYFAMNDIFYNYEEFITLIAGYLMYQVRKQQ